MERWFAASTLDRQHNCPKIAGEKEILIPCHVDGCHWVATVRGEIKGPVIFYYSDDLNHLTTELSMKSLLKNNTCNSFYPPNAIWVHCKSFTYRPHSNECDPKTLFTVLMMGLNPKPDENLLVHYMHDNLAQILRAWVALIVMTGKPVVPPLDYIRRDIA